MKRSTGLIHKFTGMPSANPFVIFPNGDEGLFEFAGWYLIDTRDIHAVEFGKRFQGDDWTHARGGSESRIGRHELKCKISTSGLTDGKYIVRVGPLFRNQPGQEEAAQF